MFRFDDAPSGTIRIRWLQFFSSFGEKRVETKCDFDAVLQRPPVASSNINCLSTSCNQATPFVKVNPLSSTSFEYHTDILYALLYNYLLFAVVGCLLLLMMNSVFSSVIFQVCFFPLCFAFRAFGHSFSVFFVVMGVRTHHARWIIEKIQNFPLRSMTPGKSNGTNNCPHSPIEERSNIRDVFCWTTKIECNITAERTWWTLDQAETCARAYMQNTATTKINKYREHWRYLIEMSRVCLPQNVAHSNGWRHARR